MPLDLLAIIQNDNVQKAALTALGAVAGWLANWWNGRERYQAHVTWETMNTMYGPQDCPVLIIQSVHPEPINITRVRIRDGFFRVLDTYPYYSEDPDYPTLPKPIEPRKQVTFVLNEQALKTALMRSRFLKWLYVPRVYVGIETMGRGERRFQAEGGLDWDERRARYRR